MSDNRRCPVNENTPRQKPERCSAQTYLYRQPPTPAGPATLGQFVSEPCLPNSHLSAVKCLRSVRYQHEQTWNTTTVWPHTPHRHILASQPASQPDWRVTRLKGCVRACWRGRADATCLLLLPPRSQLKCVDENYYNVWMNVWKILQCICLFWERIWKYTSSTAILRQEDLQGHL